MYFHKIVVHGTTRLHFTNGLVEMANEPLICQDKSYTFASQHLMAVVEETNCKHKYFPQSHGLVNWANAQIIV